MKEYRPGLNVEAGLYSINLLKELSRQRYSLI